MNYIFYTVFDFWIWYSILKKYKNILYLATQLEKVYKYKPWIHLGLLGLTEQLIQRLSIVRLGFSICTIGVILWGFTIRSWSLCTSDRLLPMSIPKKLHCYQWVQFSVLHHVHYAKLHLATRLTRVLFWTLKPNKRCKSCRPMINNRIPDKL